MQKSKAYRASASAFASVDCRKVVGVYAMQCVASLCRTSFEVR